VGGPAGSEEAAQRCTALIWAVGPTLIKGPLEEVSMMLAGLVVALLAAAGSEMLIPEGTILPVVLNETLNTARVQDNDPVLFTLADDIRAAGRRGPVLIPRGSSVVGRIVLTKRAGHFIGRSGMDIRLEEIITPSGEVYDGVSAKIVDVAKKKGQKGEVKADGGIQGPVHLQRDTFLLLFPPTTIFQLLATPKRGPDIVLPVESRLYVKLMTPIYVEAPKVAAVAPPPVNPTPLSFVAPLPQPIPQLLPPPIPQPIAQPIAQPVSADSLEILVAPVALYPDAILRDLFRASTRPFEIVQANQWVHQTRDATGSLPFFGYNPNWDPSVKALTAYPDLLQRLTVDLNWIAKLGTAYDARPYDVMNAVQRVRYQAHSLRSAAGVTVVASGR
jgi:hypothetical protein